MPEEEHHDMDKLLRAYAEARKNGVDLPLHPASRKMLQAEVARRFHAQTSQSFWQKLRAWWPRVAVASGLGAILLIAIISLRVRPTRVEEMGPPLISGNRAVVNPLKENLKDQPSETPVPANSSESLLLERKEESQFGRRRSEALQASPPASARNLGLDSDQPALARKDLDAGAASREAGPQPQEPGLPELSKPNPAPYGLATAKATFARAPLKEIALKQANLGVAGAMTNLGAALRLRFVDLPDATGQRPALPVLNSFQFERQGEDVRLLDQDGSVYFGQIHSAATNQPNYVASAGRTSEPFGFSPPSTDALVYFFLVQGTNRTLARQVTLEGGYFERTNWSRPAVIPVTTQSAAPANMPITRARHSIIGKALIDRTNEFPVNAISIDQ